MELYLANTVHSSLPHHFVKSTQRKVHMAMNAIVK